MITLLRGFSIAFLTWHFSLYFPGLAEPLAQVALVGVAFALGRVSSRLRLGLAILAAGLAFLALRLVVVGLPELLAGITATTFWDNLPLAAERQLQFALLPWAVGFWQGWWHTTDRSRLGLERLLNAALLVAVFWAQGPYHVTLYPYPLGLALALLLFLASEFLVLWGLKTPLVRRTVTAITGVAVLAVAGIALLWTLLGRYEESATASGGGLMKPDLFQFDFAPLVRLESEIRLSDHLVLLYREGGPATKRYLRRFVLTDYAPAEGFSMAKTAGAEVPPPVGRQVLRFGDSGATSRRQSVEQAYFLVNLDPSSLLALNAPVMVTPYARWDKSSFVNAYRVESRVSGDLYWEYSDAVGDGLSDEERTRALDYGGDEQLRELALSLTKGAETPYEKALAVQNWLKANFFYSLKPGVAGSEGALKHFLFTSRKGYCSYFAFSMALMLRSVGVPARVSVGFLTNPQEKVLDFYPVRAFQAHAWVEVPFDGYGWVDFDPTSEVLAPGENFQLPRAMNSDELTRMIAEILEAQPSPLVEDPLTAKTASGGLPLQAVGDWLGRWGGLLVLLVLLVAQELYRWRWTLARWGAPPRHQVELAWKLLRHHARLAGRAPSAAETPQFWAAQDWAEDVGSNARTWVDHLERARYAPAYDALQARAAHGAARELARSLQKSTPLHRRVVRAVVPWWPFAPRIPQARKNP